MKRHLNFTERARIRRRNAVVRIEPELFRGSPVFGLKLDLSGHKFSADAVIRVEAHRSNVTQRWYFGTVANFRHPSRDECRLTEIESSAQFRVFVVDPHSGKLLGLADKIRPIQPLDSLIPLEIDDGSTLKDEVWRVRFGAVTDPPVLMVNGRVSGIADIVAGDASFRALVMPQVLRQVFEHIAFVLHEKPENDDTDWFMDWFRMVRGLGVDDPDLGAWGETPNNEAVRDWIDLAVTAFSRQKVKALSIYSKVIRGQQ